MMLSDLFYFLPAVQLSVSGGEYLGLQGLSAFVHMKLSFPKPVSVEGSFLSLFAFDWPFGFVQK